jgi:hypothetical protein
VIAAVDYYHPMSGLTNKFKALYEFLKANRDLAESIVIIQYIFPIKGSLNFEHSMFTRMDKDIKAL